MNTNLPWPRHGVTFNDFGKFPEAPPTSSTRLEEADQCENTRKNVKNAGISNNEREDLIGRRGHLVFRLCNVVRATFLPPTPPFLQVHIRHDSGQLGLRNAIPPLRTTRCTI